MRPLQPDLLTITRLGAYAVNAVLDNESRKTAGELVEGVRSLPELQVKGKRRIGSLHGQMMRFLDL